MQILLAEDEKAMADAVIAYLKFQNIRVDWASNGLDALTKARMNPYDVLVLDIMMPEMDGITVLQRLRKEGCNVPALFLTARSAIPDKAHGFDAGADDYLTKPFVLQELLMRINALSRRGKAYLTDSVTLGDLTLDKDSASLRVGNASSPLSHREFQLMDHLMRNPHVFFSVERLLDLVWGLDSDYGYETVWVHISQLRKKIEALGAHVTIRSKRSLGYMLEETK